MSAFGYFADEAVRSLWRRRPANTLSLLTIVAALFVLGVFLIGHVNIQRWLAGWTEAAELSVYLADATTAEERAAIASELATSDLVARHEYISSEEASRRFERTFPDLAGAAGAVADHALPASIEVQLRPEVMHDGRVDELAARLRRAAGVADVRYDRQWIERVAAVVRAGWMAGLALAGILVLAAAVTLASVVRLALHDRQQEIEIMQLVGAPVSYIRGPFVAEGVLQGGIGAVLALMLLYVAYVVGRGRLPLEAGATVVFLPWTWVLGLLAGGMVVGCIGGLVAARSAR